MNTEDRYWQFKLKKLTYQARRHKWYKVHMVSVVLMVASIFAKGFQPDNINDSQARFFIGIVYLSILFGTSAILSFFIAEYNEFKNMQTFKE